VMMVVVVVVVVRGMGLILGALSPAGFFVLEFPDSDEILSMTLDLLSRFSWQSVVNFLPTFSVRTVLFLENLIVRRSPERIAARAPALLVALEVAQIRRSAFPLFGNVEIVVAAG